tara:strand:- start:870 stop:1256 length:387 start_codon:yes stop_codon:yes gene_type:complete
MGKIATSNSANVTAKQRVLVDTLVATGCTITKASQVAGYAKGESGRVSASKALKAPHVQAYMMQQITESIGLNATKASRKLMELSEGAKSEYVQLEASKDILDRAGFRAPDRHQHMLVGELKVNIQLD